MTVARHTYKAREVGFFSEVALSPLSVSSVEWDDKKGVVEIYTTTDPLHTLRDIDNWTKFFKPGASGSFDVPAGTRKIAIEATSSPVVGEPLLIFAQNEQSLRMLFRTGGDNWPDSVIELDTNSDPGWLEHGFSVGDVCRIDNPFLLAEEFVGDYEITSFNVAPKNSGTTVDDWARVRRVDGKTMPNVDDPGLCDFYMIPQATSKVFPTATIVSDGLTDMEQARLYGVDQLSSSSVALIPGLPDPQLWFDPTDASTVWQDAAGTIPAVDGGNVGRIDNKGTDPFLRFLDDQDFDFPKYRTNFVNGLNVLDGQSVGNEGDLRNREIGARPGALGMTMATVTRKTVIPVADEHSVQWDNSLGATPRLYWTQTGGNVWRAAHKASGVSTQVLRAVTVDEWVWTYMVSEDNNFRARASGATEHVDSSGTYIQNNDNEFFYLIQVDGQRADTLVWDFAFSTDQITALIGFLDGKYGQLPF